MSLNLIASYKHGLSDVLAKGLAVPSVLGPKSKASNFGAGDRPWLELIGYRLESPNPTPTIFSSAAMPTHIPYLLGLLAWTLDARNDVASLAYYRSSALDFSDDGISMCGAFGARLSGLHHTHDQLAALIHRIKTDSATRRTFAPILEAQDNLIETLEYPCAIGVQLLKRDGQLHWITFMRAQQALTVLPYDWALFSILHHFCASALEVPAGRYIHISGTFHIYENERVLARQVVNSEISTTSLPTIPSGKAGSVARELIELESAARHAVESGQVRELRSMQGQPVQYEFNEAALAIFTASAQPRLS